MARFWLKLFLIMTIVSLPSLFFNCAAMKTHSLKEAIDKYNLAYKWGGPAATSSLIDTSVKSEVLEKRIQEMEGKKIAEYTLASLSFESKLKAQAIVQYAYIDEATQSLHGFSELQTWEYLKGGWRITKVIDSTKPTGKTFD